LIRINKKIRIKVSYAEIRMVFASIFFIFFFLFFFIFNRYHLAFQEQLQLFIFSSDYFTGFLSRPGGLSEYAGSFLTQFFGYHHTAGFILTLTGIAVFVISKRIFSVFNIKNDFWSFIPVLFIAVFHGNHLYSLSYTIAFLAALFYFYLYLISDRRRINLTIILIAWPFLYIVAGGFAIFSGVLCLIHVLFFKQGKEKLWMLLVFAAIIVLIPFLASETVYFMGEANIYTSCIPLNLGKPIKEMTVILLLYYPIIMLISGILPEKKVLSSSKLQYASSAVLVIFLSFMVFNSFYDKNTELLLGIDYDIQRSDWKDVLEKSSKIDEPNRMVLHYTNLALFKSGLLFEKLFYYPQSGKAGLWLDWEQDWLIAFFGCGTYFHLGYNSEAYRWAYEAMVARGPNPRSLKLLSLSGLVDGNIELSSKYLNTLKKTLFYNSWAEHYSSFTDKPELINEDYEISSKRDLLIKADFINANNPGGRLLHLLREHPDNRMAFEYLMASLLLEKDLDGFAANIDRIKDIDYEKLPTLLEESIAAYMSYSGKNIVPDGYTISPQTLERLSAYADAVYSVGSNSNAAAARLYPKFGKTYWYYLKFVDHQKPLD